MLISIDKILVKDRIRKDFGDIEELAQDIQENGLINPPVVTPEYTLIAGERRLRALRSLGKTDIEVRIMTVDSAEQALNLEISENEVRKDFSKAERIDYARRLERIESLKAEQRKASTQFGSDAVGENFPSPENKGRARDAVAEKLGIGSGKQYEKEKSIVDNKDLLDPSDFTEWDEGRLSTNKAFQKIKAAQADLQKKVEELESRKPEVVEVPPADYTQVKKECASIRAQYEEMAEKWKTSEAEKRRLLAEKADPAKQQAEDAIKGMLLFNAGIANFLEKYGGYIWLTQYMDIVPENEKKGFLSGVNALEAWIYQMKNNLGGYEE